MAMFGRPSRCVAYCLGLVALVGIAGPARGVPQRFTFTGPVTGAEHCVFGPEVVGGCEEQDVSGNATYTFLVDFDRLGEHSVRDGASGETTVTTVPGTFFADSPAVPADIDFGPPDTRVTTRDRIGKGLTLRDFVDARSDAGALYEAISLIELIGLPGSNFTVGSQFEGREFFSFHAPGGAVTEENGPSCPCLP